MSSLAKPKVVVENCFARVGRYSKITPSRTVGPNLFKMSSSAQENAEEQNEIEKTKDTSEQWDGSSGAEHVPNSNTEGDGPQNRERKLTEKGMLYFTEVRGKARQHAYTTLLTQIEKVRKLLDEKEDLETLENERDRLDKLKDAFTEAQGAYDEVIDSEEDKKASYLWFDVGDRKYFEMRFKLVERIHSLQQPKAPKPNLPPAGSIKSQTSRGTKASISKSSGKSRASSSRSLKLEAAAKTARLKTEITFVERDSAMRRMQLMKEIAIAEAEERAINDALIDERQEIEVKPEPVKLDPLVSPFIPNLPPYQTQETAEPKPKVTPTYPQDNPSNLPPTVPLRIQQRENSAVKQEISPADFQPVLPMSTTIYPNANSPCHEGPARETCTLRELINLQTKQAELSSLLVQQQKRNSLPAKEPPVFSGNSFDYPAFITAFDSIISENVQSNKDRLYFLDKYTVGKANEIVRGFLAVNSEDAYTEARKLLDQRFGNPVHVAEAYKSRLRNWPQIKDGDSAGLQAFSDFLFRCQEAVKIVGSNGELDSTQNLIQVCAKLPSYSGVKWCRHAYDKRTKSGSNVSFSEFVQFVQGESDLANDPVFSPDALKGERRSLDATRENKGKVRNKADSFAISTVQEQCPATNCPLCEKTHALDKCHEFKKKKLEDRREFIKAKGLCFGCLKSGHLSVSCQSRLTCEECGKPHPTLLHNSQPAKRPPRSNKPRNSDDPVKKKAQITNPPIAPGNESMKANESACGSTSLPDAETTSSMIVPVVVHHKDRPHLEVSVYALLDDGSDSTFVTNSTLRDLGLEGTEVSLKLNTMHGKNSIPAQKVEGLVVQKLDKEAVIELPKAYSREAIPARRNQIPTPEIASKWSHLEKIKNQIPPIQDKVEVGLLIGCNCPKALLSRTTRMMLPPVIGSSLVKSVTQDLTEDS